MAFALGAAYPVRTGRCEAGPVGLTPGASAHTLAAQGFATEGLKADGVLQGNSDETMSMPLPSADPTSIAHRGRLS